MTAPLLEARSLLFLPADRTDRLDKAAASHAGGIILDLEDGVDETRKAEARSALTEAVSRLRAAGMPVVVRINAGSALSADIGAVIEAGPDAVMLPKVESPADILNLESAMSPSKAPPPCALIALIETPRGIMAAAAIADASSNLRALAFGGEDYAAAMGVSPGPEELSHAAALVAMAGRASDLATFGLVGSITEIRGEDRFRQSCILARQFGYTGALAIHPRQAAIADVAFAPTPHELAWAKRILADVEANQSSCGAFRGSDGRMIDRPVVARARTLLSRAPSG